MISSEREPMSDITITDKEVKVAVEMPGVSKEDIKINAYNGTVEVKPTISRENIMKLLKYHLKQILKLPNLIIIMEYLR